MFKLFKTTGMVIGQIDEFLDTIDQSGLVFSRGVKNYLNKRQDRFSTDLEEIDNLEKRADELRRSVEDALYRHSLMPELRSDVLALLEQMDDLADISKENLEQFDVESPFIPEVLNESIIDLTETSNKAIEAVVLCTRSFFREPRKVKDMIHRVYFHEKEGDNLSNELKRKIFRDLQDLNLSQKQHLRHFVSHIEVLSDTSENIADTLVILAIKRSV